MDRALCPRYLRHVWTLVTDYQHPRQNTGRVAMLSLTRLTPHLVTGHRAIGRCRGQAPGSRGVVSVLNSLFCPRVQNSAYKAPAKL